MGRPDGTAIQTTPGTITTPSLDGQPSFTNARLGDTGNDPQGHRTDRVAIGDRTEAGPVPAHAGGSTAGTSGPVETTGPAGVGSASATSRQEAVEIKEDPGMAPGLRDVSCQQCPPYALRG